MIRKAIAAVLLATALLLWLAQIKPSQPTPAPAPPGGLVLRGLFVSASAAADSQIIAALCDEVAAVIEWDGMQDRPRLTTGAAFDDLRTIARECRMRGESIGARQPRVRDAIAAYMTEKLGTSGGPVGPEARAQWVATLRDVSRAAADATR